MEETKTPTPATSGFIKVASAFLIATGFINFTSAMNNLREQAKLGVELSEKLINTSILGWSIITFIAGWYLVKRKKWAYILAIISILASIAFTVNIIEMNPIAYITLGLGIFIFLLLILGRKDFKQP